MNTAQYYFTSIEYFLHEYLRFSEDHMKLPQYNRIKLGIKTLLENGVFTKEELQKELFKRYGILLNDSKIWEGCELKI